MDLSNWYGSGFATLVFIWFWTVIRQPEDFYINGLNPVLWIQIDWIWIRIQVQVRIRIQGYAINFNRKN